MKHVSRKRSRAFTLIDLVLVIVTGLGPNLALLRIDRSSRGEVSQNPKIIIWLDSGPAFSQQMGIHRAHVREGAVAKSNDIVV